MPNFSQDIVNKTFTHKVYGEYTVLRKSNNVTIHNTPMYVIKFLNTGVEKEYIKTKIINNTVSDKPIKPKNKMIGKTVKVIIDVTIVDSSTTQYKVKDVNTSQIFEISKKNIIKTKESAKNGKKKN
jgi:hypothetical protein